MRKPTSLLPTSKSGCSIGDFLFDFLRYHLSCEVIIAANRGFIIELCVVHLVGETTRYTPRANEFIQIRLGVNRTCVDVLSGFPTASAYGIPLLNAPCQQRVRMIFEYW